LHFQEKIFFFFMDDQKRRFVPKRVAKEWQEYRKLLADEQKSSIYHAFAANVTLEPENDDLSRWIMTVHGEAGTLYEGGTWLLRIQLAEKYPFHPPRMQFLTKILHPQVGDNGGINLCGLLHGSQWKPWWKVPMLTIAVADLLRYPDCNDGIMNCAFAMALNNNEQEARRQVKEHIGKFAV
jgi:ubiquitin-conjugating enzyme E2 D